MSKLFTGTVISTKMMNTVVVEIEKKFRHPLYRKVIVKHNKYKAHYEGNDIQVGDVVTIKETKPISKTKHFIVVKDVVIVDKPEKTEEKAAAVKVKAAKPTKKAAAKKPTKKTKLKSS